MGGNSSKDNKIDSQGEITNTVVVEDDVKSGNDGMKIVQVCLVIIALILFIGALFKIYQCIVHKAKKRYSARPVA